MTYWYVLFVRTGSEVKIKMSLEKILNTGHFVPFIPMTQNKVKFSGKVKKEKKAMFPGYVFIETNISSVEFKSAIYSARFYVKDIIRILRYGRTFDIVVKESEREMLTGLLNNTYCVESSVGIIVGDKVYVSEGPLMGRESIIKRIDRHKKQAVIEMEFMGNIKRVVVGLEIVQKI